MTSGDRSTSNVSGDTIPEIVMPDPTEQAPATEEVEAEADGRDNALEPRRQEDSQAKDDGSASDETIEFEVGTDSNSDGSRGDAATDQSTQGATQGGGYVPRIVQNDPADAGSAGVGEQASSPTRQAEGSLNPEVAPTPTIGQIEVAQEGATAPTTAAPTTAAPTTAAPTTAAPTTTMPMEHPLNDQTSTTMDHSDHTGDHGTDNQSSMASNNLGDLDNPSVVSNYTNVPSNQLNIAALTSDFNGSIAPHNKQGQFRTRCQYSHLAYDDPIVYPNQPGAAHLHMFFGNTEVDAHSTGQSLLNSGGGSCQGGELNRSAYWIPAVFDDNDDVRIPFDFVAYYKTNRSDLVESMPTGLKMVTDSAAATPKVKWSCARNRDVNLEYGMGNVMPSCENGDMVKASIAFPECWDGRLDSGNHKSHLAYMKQDTCPSSHPRVIPTVTYNIYFQHDGNTADWYLSSDRMHGATQHANGSTLHADWLGAWNEDVMDEWTTNCTQAQFTCHVGPISADTKLKSFSNDDRYHGPNKISDGRLQPSMH